MGDRDFYRKSATMFFILSIIAVLFGATGFVGMSMEIGQALAIVFWTLSGISFMFYMITR